MMEQIIKARFFQTFLDNVKKEKSLLFEGLWDAPKALLISLLLKEFKKDIIVITGGERESKLFEDLLFFLNERVYEMPTFEALPGEDILPSSDVMGRRLELLHKLAIKKEPVVLLTSLQSYLQKVVPQETLRTLFLHFKVGEEVAFADIAPYLTMLDYKRTTVVADKGEFAIRGGIVDVFPISSPDPYRIEFFGDQIEQIRTFDPQSQKSIEKVDSFSMSPGSETNLLSKEKKLCSLTEYLDQPILIFDDLLKIEDRYAALKKMMGDRSSYFCDLLSSLEGKHKKLFWSEQSVEELSSTISGKKTGRMHYSGEEPTFDISFELFGTTLHTKKHFHPFLQVQDFLGSENLAEGIARAAELPIAFYFLSENEREEEKFKENLTIIPKKATFIYGYLSSGFAFEREGIAIIPFTEFTHRYKVRRSKWRSSHHTPLSEFHALQKGDLVVHFHNGIGRYLGVERQKNHLGIDSEFLIIEYAGDSKLYVPASQSHLVSRYIGSHEELPTLHKLGTNTWQNTKARAQKAIIGYAKELLQMQAEREVKGGFAYGEDSLEVHQFAESFPYNETEDQLRAIAEIKADMMSKKGMDRLVCGDVGYGKTEVAMRAAFKAVCDGGKQVAVLVPTTVLAVQHYETFKERFAYFSVNIGVISRFQSPKENKKTLEDVLSGKIDILIGTHRLISKDVQFKDLGLVIIDEEQRFGVRAKEKLKEFKIGVDCITMTATPIPRTLYLSLVGAKTISVINSPPHDRLPIQSILAEKDEELIKNALIRELARDGQAYFIHNRVDTIQNAAEELNKLVPAARIGVVHGQMDSEILDEIFHSFKKGELDILVATTIIENGIDIPNANTIFIDRSDSFGISDLYQLRGRVGRWNKRAYAYFLTPKNRILPEISQKRLNALVETSGFGGGMKLAMLDLEIRGAGDILGVQQSGQVSSIGFHLYCKLLKKTIDAISKKQATAFIETRMEFTFDARISEGYISDSSLRLEIYHRLGEALNLSEVDAIFAELKDRFGKPPECVIWLYHLTRIRVFANQHQFILLKFLPNAVTAERQGKKDTETKTFRIPTPTSPLELEKILFKRLLEEFP